MSAGRTGQEAIYRATSSATSPRPSTAKRTRSPGAGNFVVMLLPVITIMSRASARPLHEPIARHGPFVMNTRAEIEETLRDLRSGHFIRGEPRDG